MAALAAIACANCMLRIAIAGSARRREHLLGLPAGKAGHAGLPRAKHGRCSLLLHHGLRHLLRRGLQRWEPPIGEEWIEALLHMQNPHHHAYPFHRAMRHVVTAVHDNIHTSQ